MHKTRVEYSAIFSMISCFNKIVAQKAETKRKMDTRSDKYQIKRMMSYDEYSFEQITATIMNYDAVVINDVDAQIRNNLLKFCYKNSICTYSIPKLSDVIYSGSEDIMLFDTPMKLICGHGLTPVQYFFKRAMELILCLIAMIPSSVVMLVIAIAIKIEDGGAVFYRQRRITKDGKVFDILKFRSMIENAEADGKPHPATDNDDRITKVGKVIRTLRVESCLSFSISSREICQSWDLDQSV